MNYVFSLIESQVQILDCLIYDNKPRDQQGRSLSEELLTNDRKADCIWGSKGLSAQN